MTNSDTIHGFLRNSIPGAIFLLCTGTLLGKASVVELASYKSSGVLIPLAAYPIGLTIQWIYRAWYLWFGEEAWFQHIQAVALLNVPSCICKRSDNRNAAVCVWLYTHGSKTHESFRGWVHETFSMLHCLGASILAIFLAMGITEVLRPDSYPVKILVWLMVVAGAFIYRQDLVNTLKTQLQAFIVNERENIRPLYDQWHDERIC